MKSSGFTLIESVIALLIISIALAGLIGSYGQNTKFLAYAKEKTLSQVLINNIITETRLADRLKIGKVENDLEFGHKTWYWQSIVSKFELVEDIQMVQIKVFSSKAERDAKRPIQTQVFYVN